MSKNWKSLTLSFLLIVGLTGLGLYWFSKEQVRLLNKQFHILNLKIIDDLDTKIDAIGGFHHSKIIAFTQSNDRTAINQEIGATSEKEGKTAKSDSLAQKEWIVLYPQTRKSPFDNATAYAVMKTVIKANWLQVRTSPEEELGLFYEKSDESLLTLEDLIENKETFREQLESVLASSPAKTEDARKAHEELIKSFSAEDWSDIPFAYEKNSLILPTATISMFVFRDSLNQTYFSEETLTKFRLLEESRKQLQISPDAVTIHYK